MNNIRLAPWLALALLTAAIVGIVAPQQLGVLCWSLTKLSLGAYLGYYIHRSLERGLRPHELTGALRDAALLRRAIVVGAAIVAVGLGV